MGKRIDSESRLISYMISYHNCVLLRLGYLCAIEIKLPISIWVLHYHVSGICSQNFKFKQNKVTNYSVFFLSRKETGLCEGKKEGNYYGQGNVRC